MIVPDKTIAYYPVPNAKHIKYNIEEVNKFLKPLNKDHKRDWFNPHFYKCLPLSIGNMQGFVFSVPFDFEVHWHGGPSPDSLHILALPTENDTYSVNIKSEFGYGIFTVHFPLILKTPPGINLMTIAPPNFPTPGITPMTGVIEADNLKFTFTLNFKIDNIETPVRIPANSPIMGMIPIPRYFCDSFELKDANEIFESKIIEEEQEIVRQHALHREKQNTGVIDDNGKLYTDGSYYRGEDFLGKKFNDHQIPRKKNK